MIDVNGKNNKVEQKNNKKTKTMGDVTLKGYDMTNTVTKGTGSEYTNNELMQSMTLPAKKKKGVSKAGKTEMKLRQKMKTK